MHACACSVFIAFCKAGVRAEVGVCSYMHQHGCLELLVAFKYNNSYL